MAQDLVTAILDIMGLSADAVSDNDSLASIGIDSLQLVEVTFDDSAIHKPALVLIVLTYPVSCKLKSGCLTVMSLVHY